MASKFFKQIADAAASGGGTYINDGVYKLMIEKMFIKEADYPGGGTSFIAEFRVLESEVSPSYPDVKPNAVGSVCSIVFAVSKHASAFGNAKALLVGALGAFGYDEASITPDVIESAFTTDEMRGLIIKDTTYQKTIKTGDNKGKPITLHKWESVEQSKEDVLTQAKNLTDGKYNQKKEVVASEPKAPGSSLLARKPA